MIPEPYHKFFVSGIRYKQPVCKKLLSIASSCWLAVVFSCNSTCSHSSTRYSPSPEFIVGTWKCASTQLSKPHTQLAHWAGNTGLAFNIPWKFKWRPRFWGLLSFPLLSKIHICKACNCTNKTSTWSEKAWLAGELWGIFLSTLVLSVGPEVGKADRNSFKFVV